MPELVSEKEEREDFSGRGQFFVAMIKKGLHKIISFKYNDTKDRTLKSAELNFHKTTVIEIIFTCY